MTTTATNALTARPRRRAPVWISIFNTCTAAVALVLLALPPAAIWIAGLAFIALAVLTRTVRAARSG